MNKQDLVNEMANLSGMKKKDCVVALEALMTAICEGVVNDGAVKLAGFGSFEKRERAARKARNPQTGEAMEVPAKSSVVFKASKQLKQSVNVEA